MNEYENIDDKLARVKLNPDKISHLIVDVNGCKECKKKPCLYICPANVYNWDEDKEEIIVNFENCLECGACRIACEKKNIQWEYPKGKYGVIFKHG